MKFLLVILFFLSVEAMAGIYDYEYIGRLADLVVLHQGEKSLMIKVGETIPGTDIKIISSNRFGAKTNKGVIGMFKSEGAHLSENNTIKRSIGVRVGDEIVESSLLDDFETNSELIACPVGLEAENDNPR